MLSSIRKDNTDSISLTIDFSCDIVDIVHKRNLCAKKLTKSIDTQGKRDNLYLFSAINILYVHVTLSSYPRNLRKACMLPTLFGMTIRPCISFCRAP